MYKLLIVEDEHLIRKWLVYGIHYEELGLILVGEASNGEEGAKKILELKPDIVLTDINMPVKNAFEMFEETKTIPYKKMMLSGYSDFQNAKQAMKYGAVDFLTKPIDENELKKSLSKFVEQENKKSQRYEFSNVLQQLSFISEMRQSSDVIVNEVLLWIQKNYDQHFIMADLARDLGYSESYLYKKIKDHLGVTLSEYLTRYRLKMGVLEILNRPGAKVYEIAAQVGFSDYKYFNKLFKKYVGMTVTEFIQQLE